MDTITILEGRIKMSIYTIEKYPIGESTICCPVCGEKLFSTNGYFAKKDSVEYHYFQCQKCKAIFLEPVILDKIDNGEALIEYREDYWQMEYEAAVSRCYGAALARVAEAIYYCKVPIKKFLDIGTGTGLLLDALKLYLPEKHNIFYGIEKFPPHNGMHTQSSNYIVGDYENLNGIQFDCGVCIEVVEHLTPKMLVNMFACIARVSTPGALYLLNSGYHSYVNNENINYLDPFIRGHIISYSVESLKILLKPLGFKVFPVRGKTWLIAIEYLSKEVLNCDITDRIWNALPENLALLEDSKMGSVMRILGLESVRAYL